MGQSTFSDASLRKLVSSGLDEQYARTAGVTPVADETELPGDFTELSLCPTPGVAFPWQNPRTGDVVWQYRPDNPMTPEAKYVFPPGQHQNLGLVKTIEGPTTTAVIVEGTLQSLAVARYAPADAEVFAIPGCWGWSNEGTPTPLLAELAGLDVVVILDADASTNPDVFDAGERLGEALMLAGAASVRFSRIPASGTTGVDDYLATVDENRRSGFVEAVVARAKLKPADVKPRRRGKAKALGKATAAKLTDPNDTALAAAWAAEWAERFRWLTDDEEWFAYGTGRWGRVGATVVGDVIGEHLDEIAKQYLEAAMDETDPDTRDELEATARLLWADAKLKSVRSRASMIGSVHLRRDRLDRHPQLWCAANGVVNLSTGEIGDHDPELLLTTGSDVELDPAAQCPRFDTFLAEALPDADVRAFVMRVFALAMIGEVREHVLPVFIGEGRNGKGTLVRIMHAVFGSHAVVVKPAALLARTFDAHEQEVARMAGKRLATVEETGQGAKWDVARVNSWTGGDALTGRWMRGNSFDFHPSHTLVMTTNHRPSVGQGERAFWARYREVPFEVSFEGREDLTLEPDIITGELPGVLNRLLEALADYRRTGLNEPAAVVMATAEAKVDSDHLSRFAAEKITVTGDQEDRIPNTELHGTVARWWSQNVTGDPMISFRMFPKSMRSVLGFAANVDNPKRAKAEGRSVLTWFGIRWSEGGPGDLGTLPVCGNPGEVSGNPIMEKPEPDLGFAGTVQPSTTHNPHGATEAQDDSNPPVPANSASVPAKVPATDDLATDNVAGQTPSVPPVPLVPAKISTQLSNGELHGVGGRARGEDAHTTQGSTEGLQFAGTAGTGATGPSVVFDLETGDAARLHDHPSPRDFVRLTGMRTGGETTVGTDVDGLLTHLHRSQMVIGHNLVHFDLPALRRIDPSVDLLTMTRDHRVLDTMITEATLWPILNDKSAGAVAKAMKHFKLEPVLERRGLDPKGDVLPRLAKEYGGYDAIPVDHPEYVGYCANDVEVTGVLARAQMAELAERPRVQRDYLWREHRVHAIAAVMGAEGFAVDEPLLQRRYWTTYGRKNDLSRRLIARYGIPTVKADGKPAASPAATKGGKEAILRALHSLGANLSKLARTAKRAPSFGKDAMLEFAELHAGHHNADAIAALCETVADVNGVRTVYGTALEALHSDGRVHPQVATFQASGRWSVRSPGLTVFGKRGGRVVERAIFTATPGNVLIAIDLSQVDARAVAVHAQDHAYLDLFAPGVDSHNEVASMVWGPNPGAGNHPRRHDAKAIGHGWNYSMGLAKLAETAGVDESVSRLFDETMRERFPRLVEWKTEVIEQAESGELMDNGFGRMMRPDPERAFTQGPALMGQGTARDLMAECLLNLDDSIIRMLRAQVHDEAVFEVPATDEQEVRAALTAAFNFDWCPPGASRPVPILAETGPAGVNWSQCYD